jgi:hypothetical protein
MLAIVEPAPGLAPLRLPPLDPARVALGNRCFGRAAVSTWQAAPDTLCWRWRPGAPPATAALSLVLADGPLRCVLCLDDDAGPGLDDAIDLSAFEGQALVLAATLRCAGR